MNSIIEFGTFWVVVCLALTVTHWFVYAIGRDSGRIDGLQMTIDKLRDELKKKPKSKKKGAKK